MRIAFAEDVLIDVLCGRENSSLKLLDAVAEGKADGYVAVTTLIAIGRYAEGKVGKKRASDIVSELAFILDFLPMPAKEDVLLSMNSEAGLDAAFLMVSAAGNADVIATGHGKAFIGSGIPVMSSGEILSDINGKG